MIYGRGCNNSKAKKADVSRRKLILNMLADGFVNKQIARRLGIKETTVQTHLYRMRKLNGAQTTYQLLHLHFLHKYDYHK